MAPHRVFESHEAVAHPPSGSTVSADVGEGLVIVTVRSAEGHLLYGLVHNEVLGEKTPERISHKHVKQAGGVTPEMVRSFSQLFKRGDDCISACLQLRSMHRNSFQTCKTTCRGRWSLQHQPWPQQVTRIGPFGFLSRRTRLSDSVFGGSHCWIAEWKQKSWAMTWTAYFSYDICTAVH